MTVNNQLADELNASLKGKSIPDQLAFIADKFENEIIFSTSFGQEDQVITDFIFRNQHAIKVFTLDTGRMFEETYKVLQKTREKYEQTIRCYFPQQSSVEQLVTKKGAYSFYSSIENRKECCHIRKVEPLQRALAGNKCWITGLRAAQSTARHDLPLFEYDPAFDIIKFNPLLEWQLSDVTDYLYKNNIPYNSLHDKGFVSIGCAPCTRAIKKGEDLRAGRWWWEDNSKKECGLHETSEMENNTNSIAKPLIK